MLMAKHNNKKEIIYNIINSILAGALVFFGALSSELAQHGLNEEAFAELKTGIMVGLVTSILIALTKFKDFWDSERKEYKNHIFKFI